MKIFYGCSKPNLVLEVALEALLKQHGYRPVASGYHLIKEERDLEYGFVDVDLGKTGPQLEYNETFDEVGGTIDGGKGK